MKKAYPVTDIYVRKPQTTEDFIFTVQGNTGFIDLLDPAWGSPVPVFSIDWGDGTVTHVNSWDWVPREHTYTDGINQHTITVFDFEAGWIQFPSYQGILSILSPLPKQKSRTRFDNCFASCINLTYVHDNCFIKCVEATSFENCFYYTGLREIPEILFKSCPDVISFKYCFGLNSYIKTIPATIFDNNLKVANFDSCFYNTRASLTGNAPELWMRTNPAPSGTACFRGQTGLSNYAQIPSNWK